MQHWLTTVMTQFYKSRHNHATNGAIDG